MSVNKARQELYGHLSALSFYHLLKGRKGNSQTWPTEILSFINLNARSAIQCGVFSTVFASISVQSKPLWQVVVRSSAELQMCQRPDPMKSESRRKEQIWTCLRTTFIAQEVTPNKKKALGIGCSLFLLLRFGGNKSLVRVNFIFYASLSNWMVGCICPIEERKKEESGRQVCWTVIQIWKAKHQVTSSFIVRLQLSMAPCTRFPLSSELILLPSAHWDLTLGGGRHKLKMPRSTFAISERDCFSFTAFTYTHILTMQEAFVPSAWHSSEQDLFSKTLSTSSFRYFGKDNRTALETLHRYSIWLNTSARSRQGRRRQLLYKGRAFAHIWIIITTQVVFSSALKPSTKPQPSDQSQLLSNHPPSQKQTHIPPCCPAVTQIASTRKSCQKRINSSSARKTKLQPNKPIWTGLSWKNTWTSDWPAPLDPTWSSLPVSVTTTTSDKECVSSIR